ncbi:MAG: hypothetical protein AAFO75_03540, partial [Pseudomonadota bacterium]
NNEYQSLASDFQSEFGASWADLNGFKNGTDQLGFTATASQVADVTRDSIWERGQLASAIDQSALQPASGTVGNATPLIVGRNVTLTTTGQLGSLADPVQIDIDDLRAGTLTDAERSALAVASAPGSVLGVGTDAANGNQAVTGIDLLNIPSTVELTGITVTQTSPLFVNATGTFRATSAGDVFVQATTAPQSNGATLTIGKITAAGDVNLAAPNSILGAAPTAVTGIEAVQIESTGDVTLTAGTGNIGTEIVPITYQADGKLLSASAGQDTNLRTQTGDMEIGRVFAAATARLTAAAGDLVGYLNGVAVKANSVVLNVFGNAGTSGTPLQVQHGTIGTLSGNVGETANIYSPTISGQAPVTLAAKDFTAKTATLTSDNTLSLDNVQTTNGNLTAAAGADLSVKDVTAAGAFTSTSVTTTTAENIAATGRANISAGGDIALNGTGTTLSSGADVAINGASLTMVDGGIIQAATDIALTTTGNATIGKLVSQRISGTPVETVTINAGRILSANTTVTPNIETTSQNVTTRLTAATGIGLPTAPIHIVNSEVTATTTIGGIYINGLTSPLITPLLSAGGDIVATSDGAITATTVTSTGGSTTLSGQAAVTVGTLTAGAAANITSATGNVLIGTATSGGDQSIQAQTGIAFTTLRSTGGGIGASTNTGDITGPTVDAKTFATLSAPLGAVTVTTLTTDMGDANVNAQGTVDIQMVDVGGSGAFTSTNADVLLPDAKAGVDLIMDAAGEIRFATLDAGRDINGQAIGDVLGGTATAGRDIYFSGANIALDDAEAGRDNTIIADTDVTADNLIAGRALTVQATNGNMTVGFLKGTTVSLFARDRMQLNLIDVRDALSLSANELIANITQNRSATGPLSISLRGSIATAMASSTLAINAPRGVIFPVYYVDQSTIATNASLLRIDDGLVDRTLDIRTAAQRLWMDNTNFVPVRQRKSADVQLYEPSKSFSLALSGTSGNTSAYIVDFGVGISFTSDSFQSSHGFGAFYGGTSMVRYFSRQLENATERLDSEIEDADSALGMVVVDQFGNPLPFVDDTGDTGLTVVQKQGNGPAVNVGF